MKPHDTQPALDDLLRSNLSAPLAAESLKAMEESEGAVDCREQGLSGMTYFIARLMRPGAEGIDDLYEGLVRAPAGVPILTCWVGETGRSFVIFADRAFGDLYGIVREGRPPEVKPAGDSPAAMSDHRWTHAVQVQLADGTIEDAVLTAYTKALGEHDWVCIAEIEVAGERFAGEADDHFEAMRELCKRLEPVRLLCFGARRDTWASGMQRDMGTGTQAYLFSYPREDFKPMQSIYDPAPPETVGTAEEQREYFEKWNAARG